MGWFSSLFGGGGGPTSSRKPDWEANRFAPGVDPEAGVVPGEFSPANVSGPAGSDDSFTNAGFGPQMQRYQQLGGQLRQALQEPSDQPQIIEGGLTNSFNQNWLGQALAAGSANGAKIG